MPIDPTEIESKVEENRSIFNPADAATMVNRGELRPDMTVREFFERIGVDVDGPVTQLLQKTGEQLQKAVPINKMQALAGQPQGPPQGAGMSPPGGAPGAPPNLQGLINQTRP